MQTFGDEYLNFLTELAFNNEKAWFDVNRKRYENHVREPFKQFAVEVSQRIAEFDPAIQPLEPKDMLFRINRDLRFSKDKTPYNTWMSAVIATGGKKNSDKRPCYYFRFAVDTVAIGGGVYQPSKQMLHDIRLKVSKKSDNLHKLLEEPQYKKYWNGLSGDENKILPAEFKLLAETEPLVRKKQFTFFREYPETEVLRGGLQDWIIDHFKAAYKVKDFLDI